MSRLIESWKRKKDNTSYKKLKKKLKRERGKSLDRFATEMDKAVFEEIDCLDCANCCKGIPPIVNKTDAQRIAKKLGLSTAAFSEKHLTVDEDGDTVMNQSPCPFLLEDNKCSIYEFRPKACREYPHTATDFSAHIDYHITNAAYCPATFHILERIEQGLP